MEQKVHLMPLVILITEQRMAATLNLCRVDLCQPVTPSSSSPRQLTHSSFILASNFVFNSKLFYLSQTHYPPTSLCPLHTNVTSDLFINEDKRTFCSQSLLTLYNKYFQHTGCIRLAIIHGCWTSTSNSPTAPKEFHVTLIKVWNCFMLIAHTLPWSAIKTIKYL